ncbi:MAG: calcium/sodium antiporter [Bacteroidetes bacterium]|jgi:cation:H+ antiporter|nr:calcium/sodium antiporter [Bacteroidota bacterium]MBT6685281.1 calcium/sodium antiporter [Bacteroidota bacterium]MBT7141728.1 calcium/sodium antiporter [Bacteroidota bacterium]MBT7491426.1 calcium/sodium antiporter [Bacteroidota bacterium]
MEVFKDIVIIIFSIFAISKGAIWLVDSAAKIARRFEISELVIGLTVVAMGTSAPEFGVTILAAMKGIGDISVGNIVGSNIFNLGFILGGTAVVHSLMTNKKVIGRDGGFLFFGTLLLTFFLWDLRLSQIEGIILFSLLIVYLGYLYFRKEMLEAPAETEKLRWFDTLLLLLGFLMVLGGSHFLVESSIDIAEVMGVSNWVVAATIIAAGTSAPELATSIVAALRGHHGMSIGNLIGSDIFNLFGVLGLAAIIRPLPVEAAARPNLLMLSGMVFIVLIFMRIGWRISRKEGIILICLGLARWAWTFI